MKRAAVSFVLVAALALAGCVTLGPDFEEPDVTWLNDWQSDLYGQVGQPAAQTETDLRFWTQLFNEPALNSLVETARLFVLMNVSIHDALQTTLTSKFVYGLWRPVTAIRQADTDLNPATSPDPSWATLIPTPPYPSYAGNMATIGASAARAVALAIGTDDVQVSATWKQSGGAPDITRSWSKLSDVAQEQADSRIYGGIHYRFDNVAGQIAGKAVADYVFANFMTPR